MIRRDQKLVVRDEPRAAVDVVAVDDEQSRGPEVLLELPAHEFTEARPPYGDAEQEKPDKDGQLVGIAEPAEVRRQLGRAREKLVARRKPFLDSVGLVTGDLQQPSELRGVQPIVRARWRGPRRRRDGTNGLRGGAALR